ncbi:MAG: SPOR domain-containing protein [Candidatus Solibacter sp.]|jgi:cell division septation protein DedD
MRNNETGEFELVVGNKQLLSGFFIVVLLFAVAFAMGYVVGQNTQRPARLALEGGAAGTAANTAADPRPQPSSPVTPAPVSSAPPAPDAGQQPSADTASQADPQPTTQPATRPTTQPTQGSQPAASEKPASAPPTPGVVASSELPPGSFWQVLAVKPEVAEAIRQTLKDKGFQVSLTPGTSNLTRVLVGPYSDSPSLGRAKTALENAGFQPVRYKRD